MALPYLVHGHGVISMDVLSIVLLSVGIALILSEFALPGGFAFSLGISFIIIMVFRHFGVINNFFPLFMTWTGSALGFTIISTFVAQRVIGARGHKKDFNEDKEAKGHVVEVVAEVSPKGKEGRISFQGTTWMARSKKDILPVGSLAEICGRDNISYIVKKTNKKSNK